MKRSPIVLAFAALLSLSGCFGRGGAPDPSPSSTSTPNPGQRGIDGQRVVVAQGAEVVQATLARSCDGDACTMISRDPLGKLLVFEPKPVLSITFELEPDAVSGLVRRDGRRGEPTELSPGTLVAWRPLVEPGRSELRIIATYGTQRLEWLAIIARK